MNARKLLLIAAVIFGFSSAMPAEKQAAATMLSEWQAERTHIRSLHILDRPNRPIHFYGNAIRRRHAMHFRHYRGR